MGIIKEFMQKRHFYENEEDYYKEYFNINKKIYDIEHKINIELHTCNNYDEVKAFFESKEVKDMMEEIDNYKKRQEELQKLFEKYN